MSEQIHFRLAERNTRDAERYCGLSNSLYARPINQAYYNWQLFQCPFPSLPNVAADANDNIIGTYCLHVQETSPTKANVAWILDIMVSPLFQRRGIFRKLADFGFENLAEFNPAAIVVMANENAKRACVDGLGWNLINTFSTYFAPPKAAHAEKPFELDFEPASDFSAAGIIFGRSNISLAANARTNNYQKWRFIENPRYDYEIFVAHKTGGELFGYVVLKIFRDPISGQAFGDIVDIFWTENDSEAVAELLRFSLAYFYRQKVSSVAVWLQTNSVLDKIGMDMGFSASGQNRYFCGKVLDKQYDFLAETNRWFINMSDSEIY